MICVGEKPFQRLVAAASRSPEASGDHLLRALELRLDNVLRRTGLATSLKTARQLVLHGHVKVSGKAVNVPSYKVSPGEVVGISPKLRENVGVKLSLETAKRLNNRPSYLEWNEEQLSAKVTRLPERAEMAFPINEQLIIEYYSK
jgi:small subunit ribosomal protein S4